MSDRFKTLLCLFLIPLPLFAPYLWLDHLYFWANPDSIFYINVYTSYRDALWQGEFFPHWIANTNVGHGSVVFYNVSPLVFYITAIINAPFSFSDEHQYLLGIYMSQVFGAWAMWRWMRTHYESRIALLAALLFTGWWRYHSSHALTPLDAFWNPVLRDQRTVAGLGRGYTDDVLNLAGISPFAPVRSLSRGQV